MRIATVIGKVTLSHRSEQLRGERLLMVLPWKTETFQGAKSYDSSLVVYDELGADLGQNIAVSEGREAACPFTKPTPVDAYASALLDQIVYQPEEKP